MKFSNLVSIAIVLVASVSNVACSQDIDTPTPTQNIVTVTPAPSASAPPSDAGAPQSDTGAPSDGCYPLGKDPNPGNDCTPGCWYVDGKPYHGPVSNDVCIRICLVSGRLSDNSCAVPGDAGSDSGSTDAATDSGLTDADAADTNPETGTVTPTARIFDYDVDAHKSAIVIGGKDVWQLFVAYMLCAGPEEDVVLSSVTVTSGGDNMDDADFTAVGIMSYGTVLGTGVLPPGSTGSVNVDLTPSIWAPKGGACTPFQIVAKVAAVQASSTVGGATHGVCRSGHSPSLGLSVDATSSLKVTVTGKTSGTKISVPMGDSHFGNPMVIRKSKPIIIKQSLSTTTLANIDQDLYKFQVAADSSGSIAWKQIAFSVTTTPTVQLSNFRLRRGATDMDLTRYTIVNANSGAELTNDALPRLFSPYTILVSIVEGDEESISGSGNVYTLHATVSGAMAGEYVMTSIPQQVGAKIATGQYFASKIHGAFSLVPWVDPSPGLPGILWSDNSEIPHAPLTNLDGGSADWTNDLYVQDLGKAQLLSL